MAAGPLDKRIRIEEESATRDDMGGSADDGWVPLATLWAAREDAAGDERFAAAERSGVRSTTFRVRSSRLTRALTTAHRIFHNHAYYEIIGLGETTAGRNRFILITTTVRNDRPADL
jgi:head-tail adaptor